MWEAVITAGCALLLFGALTGWLRLRWRRTAALLAVGLLVTEAINLGGIMVTAYTAPALRTVHSLAALAGRSALAPVPAAPGAPRPAVQVVVMGDSTAAGLGNAALAQPTKQDKACQRSADTYAADLAAANRWQVLNLASQRRHHPGGHPRRPDRTGHHGPAAARGGRESVACLGHHRERRRRRRRLVGSAAAVRGQFVLRQPGVGGFFQKRLATFAVNYYQLLQQLAALPVASTGDRQPVLRPLRHQPALPGQGGPGRGQGTVPGRPPAGPVNDVLAKGAQGAALIVVRPDFTGHQLCDPEPYVQNLKAAAPFHPTPAGELDYRARRRAGAAPPGRPRLVIPGSFHLGALVRASDVPDEGDPVLDVRLKAHPRARRDADH